MSFTAWMQATVDRLNRDSVLAQTASGPLEYAAVGTGPAVLVIHGRPGGYDQGLVIARALNDPRFRFVAVSRPGYLRTPLGTGHTPQEQADAFAALLDVLGVTQAAAIAISAGGPSGLQFALRHPDRCSGLVLISAGTQRIPQAAMASRIMHSILASSDRASWLLSGLIRRLEPRMNRKMGLAPQIMQTFFPYSLRRAGAVNDLFQITHLPLYPFSEIRVPVLAVHGTADRFVPMSHAEFAVGAMPCARLIRIPAGGHGVFFAQYERLAPDILNFLKSHARERTVLQSFVTRGSSESA